MAKPPPIRKRFGQNFLHDSGVLARIVAAIDPQPDDPVVEIGPGRGALTAVLLERLERLVAVEIDRDLAAGLRAGFPPERLDLHVGDAMDLALADLGPVPPGGWRIVGNLPYNISTPLLFHLLGQATAIRDMHFLLQKEVVERMVAEPGSKRYGRLTVMLGARAQARQLFTVGPGAFRPAPKVDSAVVRIEPLAEPLVPPHLEGSFRKVVNQAFSNRRKTVRRALTGILDPAAIEAAGIDGGRRPDQLAIHDFLALADAAQPAANPAVAKPDPSPDPLRTAGDAFGPVDTTLEQP